MTTLALKIPQITTAQFWEICQVNPDLRLELTAAGEIIAMTPTHSWSGQQNSALTAQLWNWNEQTGLGVVFDSSTGFTLPNGAIRSPDVAWIQCDRWDQLTSTQQRHTFAPIAPDFVIELRSNRDDLATLRLKMQEYQDNGVRLGWLLDPQGQQVEIYRLGEPVVIVLAPSVLDGAPELPGLSVNCDKIWTGS